MAQLWILALLGTAALVRGDCRADNCLRAVRGRSELASEDCTSFLGVTILLPAGETTVTMTETSVVTLTEDNISSYSLGSGIVRKVRRQQTVYPTDMPEYASRCSDLAPYSSACSCIGVEADTVTDSGAVVTYTAGETVTVTSFVTPSASESETETESDGAAGTGDSSVSLEPTGSSTISTEPMESSTASVGPTSTCLPPDVDFGEDAPAWFQLTCKHDEGGGCSLIESDDYDVLFQHETNNRYFQMTTATVGIEAGHTFSLCPDPDSKGVMGHFRFAWEKSPVSVPWMPEVCSMAFAVVKVADDGRERVVLSVSHTSDEIWCGYHQISFLIEASEAQLGGNFYIRAPRLFECERGAAAILDGLYFEAVLEDAPVCESELLDTFDHRTFPAVGTVDCLIEPGLSFPECKRIQTNSFDWVFGSDDDFFILCSGNGQACTYTRDLSICPYADDKMLRLSLSYAILHSVPGDGAGSVGDYSYMTIDWQPSGGALGPARLSTLRYWRHSDGGRNVDLILPPEYRGGSEGNLTVKFEIGDTNSYDEPMFVLADHIAMDLVDVPTCAGTTNSLAYEMSADEGLEVGCQGFAENVAAGTCGFYAGTEYQGLLGTSDAHQGLARGNLRFSAKARLAVCSDGALVLRSTAGFALVGTGGVECRSFLAVREVGPGANPFDVVYAWENVIAIPTAPGAYVSEVEWRPRPGVVRYEISATAGCMDGEGPNEGEMVIDWLRTEPVG